MDFVVKKVKKIKKGIYILPEIDDNIINGDGRRERNEPQTRKDPNMSIHFNDNLTINTSGEYRVLKLRDGLYVVGHGVLIPVEDLGEATDLIEELQADDKNFG